MSLRQLLGIVGMLFINGLSWAQITLEPIGTYSTGLVGEEAAIIAAFDPGTRKLFVSSLAHNGVNIVDMSDPTAPVAVGLIDTSAHGAAPLSLDFANGTLAVSVRADPATNPGKVVFFKTDGELQGAVGVGAFPDALSFTPDGRKLLVANEGEANDEYTVDPEGSISIIDLSRGPALATVDTADFRGFNSHAASLRRRGVRIFGPNATVAQDLEPEKIAIGDDGRTAYVTLQENNAIAVVDIRHAVVRRIIPLGFKPYFLPGSGLDASDKDKAINIQPWPLLGMYQPDGIAVLEHHGSTYLAVANEGSQRDTDGFNETARVKTLKLSDRLLAHFPGLQDDAQLGRMVVTNQPPFGKVTTPEGEDVYHLLFSFGGRSLTIFSDRGFPVFDSGDDFEQVTAARLPASFNSTDSANGTFDTRSDDKGPEPEGITCADVHGGTYAFVGFERVGGIIIYDVSHPRCATFVDYINTRDFTATDPALAGGLSPEDLEFVPAEESPNGEPLLVVTYPESGNVVIFRIASTN